METGDRMNLLDRRVGKTRKAIFTALYELLQEKKFAKITVQEIIDRADIGRATFYSHFPTKDDVLIGYVESFFHSFNEQIRIHTEQNGMNKLFPVAAFFTHVKDNERIITGIFMSDSGAELTGRFKNYWIIKIQPVIEAHFPAGQNPGIPVDLLANHVVNTMVGLISFWIQNEFKDTPEQMEQYFFMLIQPIFSIP
jgi:AcrR family transcriptional regulator